METPKKMPYISGNGNPKKLLIFWEKDLFSPSSRKLKKSTQKKILIFREVEQSNSKIKNFVIFSQKKAFLIFPEKEPCTFQFKLEK